MECVKEKVPEILTRSRCRVYSLRKQFCVLVKSTDFPSVLVWGRIHRCASFRSRSVLAGWWWLPGVPVLCLGSVPRLVSGACCRVAVVLSPYVCVQRNSKKWMLISSVNLTTKNTPRRRSPQSHLCTAEHKFISLEYRMFCWCSAKKVFPAAHSLLPLIWNVSLFSEAILLYNSNLDM